MQQPDLDIADVTADADDSFDNSENNYEGSYSAGAYAPGYDPANMDQSIVSSDNNKGKEYVYLLFIVYCTLYQEREGKT